MSVACDVYTKLLFQWGFGHPLWEPEPTQAGEVLIGDVGYVLDGGFYRLFNATLSPDHLVNQRYGVPDDFQPFIVPDTLRHHRQHALEAGPICSKNVTVLTVDASLAATPGSFGASSNVRFKLTDEQGAILVIQHPADRELLHPCKDLTQYILHNHSSWHQFSQNTFRLDIEADRIVFVTGWVKTGGWALGAATQHARDGEISFGGDFGPAFQARFSISASQDMPMEWEHRCGPKPIDSWTTREEATEEAVPLDQCIFFHYYKLKRRPFLRPKVIRAAAIDEQLNGDADSDGPEHGMLSTAIDENENVGDSSAEIEMIPARSSQGDEIVECILDYILDETDVHSAIACDRDISLICSLSENHQDGQEYLPENMSQVLAEVRPSISVIGGVGMLSCHNTPVEEVQNIAENEVSPIRSTVVRFDTKQFWTTRRRSRSRTRRRSRSRSRSLSRAFSPFPVGQYPEEAGVCSDSELPRSAIVDANVHEGAVTGEGSRPVTRSVTRSAGNVTGGGRRPITRSITRSAGNVPLQTHDATRPSSSASQPKRSARRAPASSTAESSSRQTRKRTRTASQEVPGDGEANERPAKRPRMWAS